MVRATETDVGVGAGTTEDAAKVRSAPTPPSSAGRCARTVIAMLHVPVFVGRMLVGGRRGRVRAWRGDGVTPVRYPVGRWESYAAARWTWGSAVTQATVIATW
jgi:hypothetical protein